MSEVKFTEEELKQVKEIQDNYFDIQNQFGQVSVAKIRLQRQEEDIIKHEDQTQIFNDIENIYTYKGDAYNNSINISDIAFIKKIRK